MPLNCPSERNKSKAWGKGEDSKGRAASFLTGSHYEGIWKYISSTMQLDKQMEAEEPALDIRSLTVATLATSPRDNSLCRAGKS